MALIDVARELGEFADATRDVAYEAAAEDPASAVEALEAIVARWSAELRTATALGLEPAGSVELAASSISACMHAWVHSAYERRSGQGADAAALERLERVLDARLSMLRRSARVGAPAGVARVLATLVGTDAPVVCAVAAGASPDAGDPMQGALAVRIARLGQRLAATAAGAVYLQRRVLVPRLRSTTAGIAARRTTLASPRPRVWDAARGLAGLEPLSRVALLARVTGATWVDAGSRPHTRLDLADGTELRVNFRNVRLDGLAGPAWVWARVKVEPPAADGSLYAVAELEGPTTTAGVVWESWLRVESRAAYDPSPRSVDLVAELPPQRTTPGRLHLLSRLTHEDGD